MNEQFDGDVEVKEDILREARWPRMSLEAKQVLIIV